MTEELNVNTLQPRTSRALNGSSLLHFQIPHRHIRTKKRKPNFTPSGRKRHSIAVKSAASVGRSCWLAPLKIILRCSSDQFPSSPFSSPSHVPLLHIIRGSGALDERVLTRDSPWIMIVACSADANLREHQNRRLLTTDWSFPPALVLAG